VRPSGGISTQRNRRGEGTQALAFSNNDVAVIAWTYDKKLPNGLGFQVERGDQDGNWETEIRAGGHAIIHDKIVVIDPFDDDW
jgi:hypothetical protein